MLDLRESVDEARTRIVQVKAQLEQIDDVTKHVASAQKEDKARLESLFFLWICKKRIIRARIKYQDKILRRCEEQGRLKQLTLVSDRSFLQEASKKCPGWNVLENLTK